MKIVVVNEHSRPCLPSPSFTLEVDATDTFREVKLKLVNFLGGDPKAHVQWVNEAYFAHIRANDRSTDGDNIYDDYIVGEGGAACALCSRQSLTCREHRGLKEGDTIFLREPWSVEEEAAYGRKYAQEVSTKLLSGGAGGGVGGGSGSGRGGGGGEGGGSSRGSVCGCFRRRRKRDSNDWRDYDHQEESTCAACCRKGTRRAVVWGAMGACMLGPLVGLALSAWEVHVRIRERERWRWRWAGRETERKRDRETKRQRDRETERDRDRDRDRQRQSDRDKETETEIGRETEKPMEC